MFLDQYQTFLFDLDGVVFLGDQPLPAAASSLRRLRHMGKTLRFLTNDPRPTRSQLVYRLAQMGIEATMEEIVTSGWATADFLAQNALHSVYLLGSAGLEAELSNKGIALVEHECPQAVVVGYDEQVTFRQIQQASAFLTQGAQFIATNVEGWFPTPGGSSPATGTLVAAIRAASGKRPRIIGKPFPDMFQVALQGLDLQQGMVMIGDTPSTDVLGAHSIGIPAILVARAEPHFPAHRDFRIPDAVVPDLSHLFDPQLSLRHWRQPPFAWPQHLEVGVAAIIFDQKGQVLLGKRADNGLWGIPCGHMERGETVEEAVLREVLEETGLQVNVVRLIGLYSDPASQVFSYPGGEIVQFLTASFLCRIAGGELHADGTEVLDVAFFSPQALPDSICPMHPRWLEDALVETDGAFIR